MKGDIRTLEGKVHPVREEMPLAECFQCGVCCVRYQPQVDTSELRAISRELKISLKECKTRYAQLTYIGYLLRRTEEGCVFLTRSRDKTRATCAIYRARPEACRKWVASLDRQECREGLGRLKGTEQVLLPGELYPTKEEAELFQRQVNPPL